MPREKEAPLVIIVVGGGFCGGDLGGSQVENPASGYC